MSAEPPVDPATASDFVYLLLGLLSHAGGAEALAASVPGTPEAEPDHASGDGSHEPLYAALGLLGLARQSRRLLADVAPPLPDAPPSAPLPSARALLR